MVRIKRARWLSGFYWVVTVASYGNIELTESILLKVILWALGSVSLYCALHYGSK